MSYISTKTVEKLGWKKDSEWANREFYVIGDFVLVEHCGSWSIRKDDDLYFIEDITEDILKEYTSIVKNIYEILNDPKSHTVYSYQMAYKTLQEFYDKYEEKSEDDDDFFDL